jgi:hypothetical protein
MKTSYTDKLQEEFPKSRPSTQSPSAQVGHSAPKTFVFGMTPPMNAIREVLEQRGLIFDLANIHPVYSWLDELRDPFEQVEDIVKGLNINPDKTPYVAIVLSPMPIFTAALVCALSQYQNLTCIFIQYRHTQDSYLCFDYTF